MEEDSSSYLKAMRMLVEDFADLPNKASRARSVVDKNYELISKDPLAKVLAINIYFYAGRHEELRELVSKPLELPEVDYKFYGISYRSPLGFEISLDDSINVYEASLTASIIKSAASAIRRYKGIVNELITHSSRLPKQLARFLRPLMYYYVKTLDIEIDIATEKNARRIIYSTDPAELEFESSVAVIGEPLKVALTYLYAETARLYEYPNVAAELYSRVPHRELEELGVSTRRKYVESVMNGIRRLTIDMHDYRKARDLYEKFLRSESVEAPEVPEEFPDKPLMRFVLARNLSRRGRIGEAIILYYNVLKELDSVPEDSYLRRYSLRTLNTAANELALRLTLTGNLEAALKVVSEYSNAFKKKS